MARSRSTSEELPAGLVELSPPPDMPQSPGNGEPAASRFWRCRIYLTTHTEPGAPDHVVRAVDRANAEAAFFQEMGILSVDRTVNHFTIEPATELEYLQAQARRLRLDLREHRAVPAGARKNVKGVVEGYYPLSWQPPGGAEAQYLINEKGEVKPAE